MVLATRSPGRLASLVAVGALVASVLTIGGGADPADAAVDGGTRTPDLLSVENFRPAGENLGGTAAEDTLVDFVFDEPAANASCCARFALVPVDGGTPSPALTREGGDGTTTHTMSFDGAIDAADIARGVVDQNAVRAQDGGDETNNPPMAAAVSNDGNTTPDPDLVSVTRDGDQMLFEFDQALTSEDVIQNTSGLRFYTSTGDTYESSNVKPTEGSERVLRAIYDLPPGVTLDDAVGGFVPFGTVNAEGDDDAVNELDEVAPVGDTGAVVCAAAAATGSRGDGSGVTEAPDLLSVGNFRRGPFTSQYEPTTCVDFVFDQRAYLNGGDRSNFALVPLDASDALSGTTNVTPDDQAGDAVVTVAFPGDLAAGDWARGYVDTGVVNSREAGATKNNPFNINQSEPVTPNDTTENPDLVSARRDGNSYLFTFDEPLTDDDVAQNSSGFRLYFPDAEQGSTIPFANSSRVEAVDDRTLRAFYEGTVPGDYTLGDAVGAYVVQGSVQAAAGSRGGNDGVNAFDERLAQRPQASRLAGDTRWGTAATIALEAFPDGADVVYLARGGDVVDAIAAGVLTAGPILLVPSCGDLPDVVVDALERLDPSTVTALGGTSAICEDVLDRAASVAAAEKDRLAGDTRFGTAAAIALEAFPSGSDVAYLARAGNPVDAVAGGALTDGPILVVPSCGDLPDVVVDALERLGPSTVTALGGQAAICDDLLERAAAVTGATTDRLSGPTRYATAAAIAHEAFPDGAEVGYLARADKVVDAVAGGVLTDGPILLVPSCGDLPDVVADALRRLEPATVTALGGPNAVCADLLQQALAAVYD